MRSTRWRAAGPGRKDIVRGADVRASELRLQKQIDQVCVDVKPTEADLRTARPSGSSLPSSRRRPPGISSTAKLAYREMSTTNLYEQDIHAWTRQTAELLKARRFQDIDVEHLIEELESMTRRDRQELVSRLKILLGHLLKWQYQPAHRCSSWLGSILEQRLRVRDLLNDSPSLKPLLAEAADRAYADGARLASRETGLPLQQFPTSVPYPLEYLLDDDWLPDPP